MKVKYLNVSSRKTNQIIKETFAELIQEKKELNNITVTELVKKANITRSAFYTHFDSIYDIAQEIQDETLDLLMTNLNGIQTIDDLDHYLDIIFNYLKENEKIYSMLLSSNDPMLFSNRLSKTINKYILSLLKETKHENLELKVSFYTDGCMHLIIKHFRKEINNSLDDLNIFMKEAFRGLFIK
ncbi:MAG: TetR/AcrR family transcriptional regulator [Bacilli bacterium]|nr:TetR/AcrR family transcriptional regulator [Bacilli bacterium]